MFVPIGKERYCSAVRIPRKIDLLAQTIHSKITFTVSYALRASLTTQPLFVGLHDGSFCLVLFEITLHHAFDILGRQVSPRRRVLVAPPTPDLLKLIF